MDLINQLDSVDKSIMLYLNGFHNSFWDQIMIIISEKKTWIPLYTIIIFSFLRSYKWKGFIYITAIVVAVVLSDQIASGFFKHTFERLRPCHQEGFNLLLHIPSQCGGQYGFFSSHAATTFALASFLIILFRKRNKWSYLFGIWAGTVSYSRIYLGVHFPFDVLCGTICGVISAIVIFYLAKNIAKHYEYYL